MRNIGKELLRIIPNNLQVLN